MQVVIVAFLLSQCISSAIGLQCYHCTYNNFDSSNPFLSTVLSALSKLSNDHCQLLSPNDGYELAIRHCPRARPGHVYKCGVITGTVTSDFNLFQVEYNTIERDCIEVQEDDPDYSDGTHDDLPASGPIRDLIQETFQGLNLGDVVFSGQALYDSSPIQVSGPVCPRCTYTRLETDNAVLQFFIDAIRLISKDDCLFEDADDVYDVSYRNCPPAGYGESSKCGDIDGRITGRIIGINFELTTLQRDCVNVPQGEASCSDGCHDSDENNAPVIMPLVQEAYGSNYQVSAISFEGQACFEPEFAPLVASDNGAGGLRTPAMMALLLSSLTTVIALYSLH